MPLAEGARAVAVEPQHLRQGRHAVRILPGVAGEGRRALHDRAGIDGVMVPSGLERVAGRRAQRRGVEVVEAQAGLGQLVHRGRADGPAERAGPAEADVVDQHDDDVGRALGRLDLEPRRRLGLARVELGVGRRLGLRDRQDRAIELVLRRHRGGGDGQREAKHRETRHSLHVCLPLSVEGRWCRPRPRFQLARYQPVISGTGAGSEPAAATRPHCPVSPRHSAVALRVHGPLFRGAGSGPRPPRSAPSTGLVLRSQSAVMIRDEVGYHASGKLESVNGWISIWFTSRPSLSPASDRTLWVGQAVPCERRECLPVGTAPIASHRQEQSGQPRCPVRA